MSLKTIKLENEDYQQYLSGREVRCASTHLATKELHEGEHVMVFRDTVATSTDATAPRRELQAEYIGVEGMVTRVQGPDAGVIIRKL